MVQLGQVSLSCDQWSLPYMWWWSIECFFLYHPPHSRRNLKIQRRDNISKNLGIAINILEWEEATGDQFSVIALLWRSPKVTNLVLSLSRDPFIFIFTSTISMTTVFICFGKVFLFFSLMFLTSYVSPVAGMNALRLRDIPHERTKGTMNG